MMRSAALIACCVSLFACDEQVGETPEIDRQGIEQPSEDSWVSGPWPWMSGDPEVDGLIEIAPKGQSKILHSLGRVPNEVQCYVGFSSDASWIMPSAGNACEIRDVNEQYITIRNGSGGSFFYRFVLR